MRFDGTQKMLDKIKLIIWDLDETFWEGTVSEEKVIIPLEHIKLIKDLSYRGIVNSICSKNNLDDIKRILEEKKIYDYFVFVSVNWEAKGKRIKQMIDNMNLRPNNVLFIDDNVSNLREVEYYCPEIMIAMPKEIPVIINAVESLGKDDSSLSRLKQYKVLEKKKFESVKYNSNEEFLASSHIILEIKKPDVQMATRIHELILRTNQLNFTKNRCTLQEVENLVVDPNISCGCVYVSDDFGKYGMVGFYAIKDNKFIHFLFSCRTMGMGIEQYVYAYLQCPNLDVVPPVSGSLDKDAPCPSYIAKGTITEHDIGKDLDIHKILLKGPCDLEAMASYLEDQGCLETEFNFMNSQGMQVDFFNHTINILNTLFLPDEEKQRLARKYPFLCYEAYTTNLFTKPYDVICLSALMDTTLGVYRHKENNYYVVYGLYSRPITDSRNWQDYIDKKIMTARSSFTREQFEQFSKEFELVEYEAKDIANNIKKIIKEVVQSFPNTQFVIITLSELEYKTNNQKEYVFPGKERFHRDVNMELQKIFKKNENVNFLDVNKFVVSQGCYYDNINHYSKLVYYKMAQELIEILHKKSDIIIGTTEKKDMLKQHFRRIMQKIYHKYYKRDIN